DIPSVKRAFILSSSSNPKEFIQRRGRVLRKFEGKEFAEIYDFNFKRQKQLFHVDNNLSYKRVQNVI
ncbi:MAG: hypothetical protein U9N59_00825, partial [Campylobacterota bacterium]|nr:hypothetical protein [Campylobacterota bacterium]